MRIKSILTAMIVAVAAFSNAAEAKMSIEAWKGTKVLKLADRDAAGKFLGWGQLSMESWNDGDNTSEWVARKANGQFVSGYKGKLEKFAFNRNGNEDLLLVIRDTKGKFVTWVNMEDRLTMKWENHSGKGWVYVIRDAYNGRFVNWAKAKFENWSRKGKVLVVRDTADDENNGKILTVIYPEYDARGVAHYRDPETGRFVSESK